MNNVSSISIFTTDINLVVRSWDDWLAELMNLSPELAEGIPLNELLPDLESSGISLYFRRVLQNGLVETLPWETYPYLFKFPVAGFSPYYEVMQQRVTIAPLREGNQILGTVVTIEDITPQLNLAKDLKLQLANPDETVRLRCVQAIAQSPVLKPEEMLIGALGDISWRVRRAAVDGLAQLSGSSLATSLLRRLREEHRNPSVLNGVLQVLAHSKVDIVPALIDCLNEQDADLRIYAAQALGEQHDDRAVAALMQALEDPNSNVRYHAIDALGQLQVQEAAEQLVSIALSGDFFLAFPALDALTRIGDSTVVSRLTPLLEDELLCTAVTTLLGQLGDASVVPALASLLNKSDAPIAEVAAAISNLSDRYESLLGEGRYIAEKASAAIDAAGVQNLLALVEIISNLKLQVSGFPYPSGTGNLKSPISTPHSDLRALVLILSHLEGNGVEQALTQLLGQPTVRKAAIEALVRYGKRVTDLLIDQLQADDLEVRRAAVVALGRIGDAKAVPVLSALLTRDPDLNVATAGALAQIGDRRAFDALLGLVGHPDAAVRQAVVAALNSLGHPEMLTAIIDLLQDADPHVRESAVKIAGYFAFNECVTLLLERCHDRDENVRRAAIESIPYLENGPVLPTLIEALKKETPKVRAAAARALGQMESNLAYPYLLAALKDGDAWVRYYAARSIGWNGYPEAVEELSRMAIADPAPQVRIAAVEALGRIGGARVVSILASLAEDLESSSDLVRAALIGLGEIGHPNSLPPLLASLHSRDPERRTHAAVALGKRGGMGVEAALQSLATTDTEMRVVQAAIEALTVLSTPEAIAALVELTANPTRNHLCIVALANLGETQIEAIGRGLNHPNAKVRCAVVEVLTRLKHPRASEISIAALDDLDTCVRLAAVSALEHLGNRYAERKIAVLARTDPDPTVRRAAQNAHGH